MSPYPVIIIAGPTASGKSSLGLMLSERMNGIIINSDSMQVYREIPVLTASPSRQDKDRYIHRLYNYKSVTEKLSVASWRQDCLAEINHAITRHQLPIVIGGTGLYLKILETGISTIPSIPTVILDKFNQQVREGKLSKLYQLLTTCDPHYAVMLKPNDTQRIIRALSVYDYTGKPISYWHALPLMTGDIKHLKFIKIFVETNRDHLNQQATVRFHDMLRNNVINEVQNLIQSIPNQIIINLKPVGLQEIIRYCSEKDSYENMIAGTLTATRQYIKRQFTWFRHQFQPDIVLKTATLEPDLIAKISAQIHNIKKG